MRIDLTIKQTLQEVLQEQGFSDVSIHLEQPQSESFGDYSTNVAMQLAKQAGENPRDLAGRIAEALAESLSVASSVTVAGPGFINITIAPQSVHEYVHALTSKPEEYGKTDLYEGKRIMVEYTDPNPFKVFHIGHLMSNTIGESLARLYEYGGAEVVRANYQGDVGLHVAKAMWGIHQDMDHFPKDTDLLADKTAFLGKAYVAGATAYEESADAKEEINHLNKIIFENSDPEIHGIYIAGRTWSLDHFEEIYKKLGTSFVHYFFESEVAERGIVLVNEKLEEGVFEKSEGAIIFDGEKHGLHKRVFINSLGLPTYEAKEIGLNYAKHEKEPNLDMSVVITAVEQKEYMRVVLKALEQFNPEITSKTKHITHGMMRFAEGKMSSRKGNVISGESLLEELETAATERLREGVPEGVATQIAVAAIKYSVLKQSPGKDIIFDPEQSLSFEGDSGPYLQYTYARTQSLLRKAAEAGVDLVKDETAELELVDRILMHYPEAVEHAQHEEAPQYIAGYAIELAREFNSWYGRERILDGNNPGSALSRVHAVGVVLKSALHLLGVQAPDKM